MEKKVLNYRIIIEKERSGRKGRYVFNAYCPTLGIADYGNTIDQAIDRITSLMHFHIESLIEEKYPVPVEKDATTVITSIAIETSPHAKFTYL